MEKYESIWDKIGNIMKEAFDKDPVYEKKKILNTKIKSFNDKITTDFYDNKGKQKIPKIGSSDFCVSEIVLVSVYRMKNNDDDDKYYPQIHLEQCR